SVPALDAMIGVAVVRLLELSLTFNRQDVVLEGHLDVLALHVGQFRADDHVLLGGLDDVDRWYPGTLRNRLTLPHRIEHPVQTIDLQCRQAGNGTPTGQSHDAPPFYLSRWSLL